MASTDTEAPANPETTPAPDTNGQALPARIDDQERPLSRTGAIGWGAAPGNFDEAYRMACVMAKSELVPKAYKTKPDDILVAMQFGAEIGLAPMAALQSIAVINGRPGVYGDGFLGVIQSQRTYQRHVEYFVNAAGERVQSLTEQDLKDDRSKAVSMFYRRGNPEPFAYEFSIADAKRAKLWNKDGPWQQYPARQLMWRARTYAGRNGFSAELRGLTTVEELNDLPGGDLPEVTAATLPAEPVRLSQRALVEAPSADAAAPSEIADPAPAAPEPADPVSDPAPAQPTKRSTKAPAAPAESAAGPFKNLAPEVTTQNMAITDTRIASLKDVRVYEIDAVVRQKGQAAIAMTFQTANEELYQSAASCEGSETLFNITWQGGKRADTNASCKVLVRIEAAG
jgi:hypothetical protein